MKLRHHLVLASAILAIPSIASAAVVSVNSSAADLSNPAGEGADTVTYFNTDGLAGNEAVTYGEQASVNGPSGLRFASAAAQDVTVGDTFVLGTLTFTNFPVYKNIDQLDLSISSALTYLGGALSGGPFAFAIKLDNTPNENPCAYESTTPCADALTVSALSTTSTFTLGDDTLTLYIDGFQDETGAFSTTYIAQENGTSSASLIGRFDLATAAVPEPASWAMMIAGFGLIGGAMRRRTARVAFA